jgi:hypothetical protein
MSIPGVPKGLRRQVLAAFINALRSDPKLANNRVIKTWMTWNGSDPIVDPSEAAMPGIQIRLLGGPVRRLTTTRAPRKPMSHGDESELTVLIDLWTAGTDQGDLSDLADLIYSALAPQDMDARAELAERFRVAGIKDWQLKREILPMSAESFGQIAVVGQGSYELTLQFFS